MSAINMPPMHSVCHISFFHNRVDGRDDFEKSRTDIGAKSI